MHLKKMEILAGLGPQAEKQLIRIHHLLGLMKLLPNFWKQAKNRTNRPCFRSISKSNLDSKLFASFRNSESLESSGHSWTIQQVIGLMFNSSAYVSNKCDRNTPHTTRTLYSLWELILVFQVVATPPEPSAADLKVLSILLPYSCWRCVSAIFMNKHCDEYSFQSLDAQVVLLGFAS